MRVRGTRPRHGPALLAVCLLAASLLSGDGATAEDTPPDYPVPVTPADYRRPLGKLVPPEGALFGAHVREQADVAGTQAEWEQLEADVGRKMDLHNHYYPWEEGFPSWREPYDLAHGRYPLIGWGCEDVDKILSGQWDALIDARADALKALEKPLFLRWCWEMDGRRPEKSKRVKSPERFIAAWQYLWKRVYDRGATNVVRVWCPNARGFKSNDAQPFYPGDEWVDWICTDGYNWAPGRKEDWRSFVEIFDEFYKFGVSRYKPLMVGEWGAQERNPGDKAAWIAEAQVAAREKLPAIAAVVVFSVDHHFDWRVTTSPDSYEAFIAWGKDPYFNPPDPTFTHGPAENTAPGPLPPWQPSADQPPDDSADQPPDDSVDYPPDDSAGQPPPDDTGAQPPPDDGAGPSQ